MNRADWEQRWLELTRQRMPAAAHARSWPVTADHCFQRILLDNAAGTVWYNVITKRPAYRHAPDDLLRSAVTLGEQALAGHVDLWDLNQKSLHYRGKC